MVNCLTLVRSYLALVALALLAPSCYCTAEKPPMARYATALTPLVEEFLRVQEIPGLAIAVVQDGQIVYCRAFGRKTLNPKVVPPIFPKGQRLDGQVTKDTAFHMASITKTLVAASVLQMVNDGKVRLDSPVVEYLPEFSMSDPRFTHITVRQLLNHTAGIPDRVGVHGHGWDHPETDDGAMLRFVESLKSDKLLFDPGTRFEYSNVGYDILGAMIAKVSKKSFEAYIRENILQPLRMENSSLLLTDLRPNTLATGHVTDEKEDPVAVTLYPFNRAQTGGGGLVSDVADMARYMIANLNRGSLDRKRFENENAFDLLWAPAMTTGLGGSLGKYGFGWYVGSFEGEKIVSHTGKDTGFLSYMALLPDKNVGVVWMMNGDWADNVFSLSDTALEIALGHPVKQRDVRRDLPAVLATDFQGGKDINWVVNKYADLYARKRDSFNFAEERLDLLGDYLIKQGRAADAVEIYRLNAKQFPGSPHAQAKLADAEKLAAGKNQRTLR